MCDFGEPDAQEVSLGMDTHCLVTPDQGTAYGCVRLVELDGDVLRVTLDPASLDELGLTDPVIEAVLCAPEADTARLRPARCPPSSEGPVETRMPRGGCPCRADR